MQQNEEHSFSWHVSKSVDFLWIKWIPFTIGMCMSLIGPIIPEIRDDLKISATKMGIAIAIASLTAMVTCSQAGILSDRRGKSFFLRIALIASLTGILLIIVASQSYFVFVAGYLFFFSSVSVMVVSMRGSVADIYPANRTLALTRAAIFWNIGAAICNLTIAILLAFHISWRSIFIIVAIQLIWTYIFFWRISSNKIKPLSRTKTSIIEKFYLNGSSILLLVTIFSMESCITFNTWLPTYLSSGTNASRVVSSLAMGCFWLLFVFGVWFKRWIYQYWDELKILFFCALAILLALITFYLTSSLNIKIFSALLVGFMYASMPVMVTALAINQFPHNSGSLSGALQSAMILGGLLAQPITGLVVDLFGEQQGVLVPIAFALFSLALIQLLHWHLKTPQKKYV